MAVPTGVVMREARPEDAEQMIVHLQRIADEPYSNIALSPGEFNPPVEEERDFIRQCAEEDNSLCWVAEADGQIIGLLTCNGGRRRATRHTTSLGISLHRDWRDKGIGNAMMIYAVEWAKRTGVVTRIELGVFPRNARGIHLYEKHGFQHEGRKLRALYLDDEYLDSLEMALLIDAIRD